MDADEAEPVGITEIAKRLHVPRHNVARWRDRNLLPPVRWTVGGRPAWDWQLDIEPWARATGRLPDNP